MVARAQRVRAGRNLDGSPVGSAPTIDPGQVGADTTRAFTGLTPVRLVWQLSQLNGARPRCKRGRRQAPQPLNDWSTYMIRYYACALCATVLACSSPVGHPDAGTTGGGDGGSSVPCPDGCDDGNPCTADECRESECAHAPLPAGTICEGTADEPIHGECEAPPAAVCGITEWTCIKGNPGDKCIGGICAINHQCCSGGCINKQGYCTFGPSGGVPCPSNGGAS